ncbi:MAG: hypothetical protein K5739_00430 [Lachnospiraceae bacterium]|nr:hypothetical protein [Lachnospiraceae bacterium]
MDDYLRGLIDRKLHIGQVSFTFAEIALVLFGSLLSGMIRFKMGALSSLPADVILAILGAVFVYCVTKKAERSAVAYCLLLLLPSFLLAGSEKRMTECLSLCFVLLFILCAWKRKGMAAAVCFAAAVFCQPAALLVLPLYLALVHIRKIPLYGYLILAGGFVGRLFFCRMFGRGFSGIDRSVITGIANIYTLIGTGNYEAEYGKAGILLGAAALLGSLYMLFQAKYEAKAEGLMEIGLFYLLLETFILPYMMPSHLRLAEVMAWLLALAGTERKMIPAATAVSLCSFAACTHLYAADVPLPMAAFALLHGAVLLFAGSRIVSRMVRRPEHG